jgi:hypothetical protein
LLIMSCMHQISTWAKEIKDVKYNNDFLSAELEDETAKIGLSDFPKNDQFAKGSRRFIEESNRRDSNSRGRFFGVGFKRSVHCKSAKR